MLEYQKSGRRRKISIMNSKTAGNSNRYSITEGRLLPSFIMFILPLIAAVWLQQSYSVADGMILGNVINQQALGATASVGAITDLCIMIQLALGSGCSILLSHLQGAKKYHESWQLIKAMRSLVTMISVFIAIAAIIFAKSILIFLHTPDSLIEDATTYMKITCIGIPFMSLYNVQAGMLRGMGDSKRPLGGIAVSSAVNIGLDILFVIILRKGIAGAAIATVSAEGMSALYLYHKLEEMRKTFEAETCYDEENSITTKADKRVGANIQESISLGAPQMVQSAATSAGRVLLQNITNILGSAVVIGVSVAFKIDAVLMAPLMSLGAAVAVFTGQNIGASKPERVRDTVKLGAAAAMLLSVALTVVLWLFGYQMISIFGLGKDAVDIGYRYLLICIPFYWLFGIQFVLSGYLNGNKKTIATSIASIAGLAARIAFAYLFYKHFSSDVLPIAEVLSWLIAVIVDVGAIYMLKRKMRE